LLISPLFLFWFYWFGSFLLHFSQICKGFVNLVYFFKEPAFCSVDSLYFFFGLHFINFSLIGMISLLLLVFHFAYSCFSRSLRCSIRSFIWDLSVLLIYTLMATNFPLKTALALSHKFWRWCFHFHELPATF
jgi:hypothetical protein